MGPAALDPPYESNSKQPKAHGGRSPRPTRRRVRVPALRNRYPAPSGPRAQPAADEKAGTRSGFAERVSGAERPPGAARGRREGGFAFRLCGTGIRRRAAPGRRPRPSRRRVRVPALRNGYPAPSGPRAQPAADEKAGTRSGSAKPYPAPSGPRAQPAADEKAGARSGSAERVSGAERPPGAARGRREGGCAFRLGETVSGAERPPGAARGRREGGYAFRLGGTCIRRRAAPGRSPRPTRRRVRVPARRNVYPAPSGPRRHAAWVFDRAPASAARNASMPALLTGLLK